VSIEGTSNIHGYTASSTALTIAALDVDAADEDVLGRALEPNAIRAVEVVIPTTSLTSPRDGIDKNMHKALKATEHPDIRFRLRSLDAAAVTATGQLAIAGVEKDVIPERPGKAAGCRPRRDRDDLADDDGLRRDAAEGHAGHAEDESEGHHHLRTRAQPVVVLIAAEEAP
jgi:hypothetical protein